MSDNYEELIGRHVKGRLEYTEEGVIKVVEVDGRLDAIGPLDKEFMVIAIGDLIPTLDGGVVHIIPNSLTTTVMLAGVE